MARPRVFISSTFYDLRQVREDLHRTIRELGYEPIRHETGQIAYPKNEKLEAAAYREVDLCDVFVSVIGGRYGTGSATNPGASISQTEVRRALTRGVQVFIFVEHAVYAEYRTYKLNKEVKGVTYSSVDNVKIFEFLEELHKLPQNNAMTSFEVAQDISNYLRDQFAGLFHQFLQEQKRETEMRVLEEMNATARTLKEVVTFLTQEREKGTADAIKSILLVNHPAFAEFAKLTDTPYRVFFTSRAELDVWLQQRSYVVNADGDSHDDDSVLEWVHSKKPPTSYLKLTKNIFDEAGNLINIAPTEWRQEWLQRVKLPEMPKQVEKPPPAAGAGYDDNGYVPSDDDIPF